LCLPPFDLTDRSETFQQTTVLLLGYFRRLFRIVAAGEQKAALGRHEGGEKGPTMSENTWQDGRLAASEEACGETTRETSRSYGVSRVCGG
jgi:hypothetical protein